MPSLGGNVLLLLFLCKEPHKKFMGTFNPKEIRNSLVDVPQCELLLVQWTSILVVVANPCHCQFMGSTLFLAPKNKIHENSRLYITINTQSSFIGCIVH